MEVLVNNAGMAVLGDMDAPATSIASRLAEWQRSLDRNLGTAFLVTRALLPAMKRRGYGRIVNISSTTGAVTAVAGDTAYAAAKAGMVGFTRAVALEAARFGVTVNAVAPGWIATGSQTEREAAAGTRTPVGRSGRPDESGEPGRVARVAAGVVRHRAADRGGRRQLGRRGPERMTRAGRAGERSGRRHRRGDGAALRRGRLARGRTSTSMPRRSSGCGDGAMVARVAGDIRTADACRALVAQAMAATWAASMRS